MRHPSRRQALESSGAGFASVALGAMMAAEARPAGESLAASAPRLPARAKRVIFLFQYGGPSTFDLFDYKPDLQKLDGKPVPLSATATTAKEKLTQLDPEKAKELPQQPVDADPGSLF